jgi:uroporphyrinogen-III synthase
VTARLSGRVVATTRDGDPADPLTAALRAESAEVRVWPTISFEKTENPLLLSLALSRLREFDWVAFTSARAVEAVGRIAAWPSGGPRVAAVGEGTASSLRKREWPVDVAGEGDGALGLARAMSQAHSLTGARVLFLAGSLASRVLEAELAARGATVQRVEAYRTRIAPPPREAVRGDLDRGVHAVVFTSPSAVRGLAEVLTHDLAGALAPCAIVAGGPTTATALGEVGVVATAVAATPDAEGLVSACVEGIESRARTA